MGPEDAALLARRALVRVADPAAHAEPAAEAEAALRASLDEVGRLDAEVEALADELADFARRWERAVAAAFQDLGGAERLVRRLQALDEGLTALAAALREGPPPRVRRRRRRAGPAAHAAHYAH